MKVTLDKRDPSQAHALLDAREHAGMSSAARSRTIEGMRNLARGYRAFVVTAWIKRDEHFVALDSFYVEPN